eukprot:gb/GFBE01063823.1/.p1 GENE.gb/GFBE01063823.1/~~gb/GFBE01063823.1/.p1  ORF type:complete len:172 (+),score=57.83 gb/GFBE01063823.1/:1-516(+)
MDITKFKAAVNGGCPCNAQYMADVGPYNLLLGETKDYSGSGHTFATSNQVFSSTFPDGFAFECLEVFSGPPNVLFKWRHFGNYSGTFTDKAGKKYKGNGEMFNLIGMCMAKVNEELKIESLDIYYNPEDMIKPLTTSMVDWGNRPMAEEGEDKEANSLAACSANGQGCSVM